MCETISTLEQVSLERHDGRVSLTAQRFSPKDVMLSKIQGPTYQENDRFSQTGDGVPKQKYRPVDLRLHLRLQVGAAIATEQNPTIFA